MNIFKCSHTTLSFDFGSANTVVFKDGKVVFDEPTIVAYRLDGEINIGRSALLMYESPNKGFVKPIINGYVGDFHAFDQYVRGLLRILVRFPKRPRFSSVCIAIPDDLSGDEHRTMCDRVFFDPFREKGIEDIKVVHQSVAACRGLNLPSSKYNLIVDIGYGKTRASLVKESQVIKTKLLRNVSGNVWLTEIRDYLKAQHQIPFGEVTAKRLLISVAAASEEINDVPDPLRLSGPNVVTGHIHSFTIEHKELAEVLNENLRSFEKELNGFIEEELMTISQKAADDIRTEGLWLIGGCSRLRGLPERLEKRLGLAVHTVDDPFYVIAKGADLSKNL